MRIRVGSMNPAKVEAVVASSPSGSTVVGIDAPSNVSNQPKGDEETLQGAINRARNCLQMDPDAEVGVGLEGGIMTVGDSVYLCNWGALATRSGDVHVASGARIPLPQKIVEGLKQGMELGDVMDDYAKTKGVRLHLGAIGILTHGEVTRVEMFTHVTKLLFSQA